MHWLYVCHRPVAVSNITAQPKQGSQGQWVAIFFICQWLDQRKLNILKLLLVHPLPKWWQEIPGVNVVRPFIFIADEEPNKVFFPGKPFQTSQMFASRARSLPWKGLTERCFTWSGFFRSYYQAFDWAERYCQV